MERPTSKHLLNKFGTLSHHSDEKVVLQKYLTLYLPTNILNILFHLILSSVIGNNH